jgi:hypothetical protein
MAFGSIVATQLAQTLADGHREGGHGKPVTNAVGGAAAALAAFLVVPPLRNFLGLPPAGPASLALILAPAPASLAVARLLGGEDQSAVAGGLPSPGYL